MLYYECLVVIPSMQCVYYTDNNTYIILPGFQTLPSAQYSTELCAF